MIDETLDPQRSRDNEDDIKFYSQLLESKGRMSLLLSRLPDFRENLEENGHAIPDGEIQVVHTEKNPIGVAGMATKLTIKSKGEEPILVYAKKSTPALPKYPDKEHAFTPQDRQKREMEALKYIKQLNITDLRVPTILSYYPERNILFTLNVEGSENSEMIGPQTETGKEAVLGRILAEIHKQSYDPNSHPSESDATLAGEILDFRSTGGREKNKDDREFRKIFETFQEQTRQNMNCQTHGDLTPRNVRSLPGSEVSMYDFELSQKHGDPASDVGFFLGHYALEMIKDPNNSQAISRKAMAFWNAYKSGWGDNQNIDIAELEDRVAKYIGVTLFYRGWFTVSMPIEPKIQNPIYERAREVFDLHHISEVFNVGETQDLLNQSPNTQLD